MSNRYATFKLMNGEEILGKVITMTEKEIVINEPVQIHRLVSGGDMGQEYVRCSYWMLFSNNPTVTIDRRNVLAYAEDLHPGTIRHYETFLRWQNENRPVYEHDDDTEMRKKMSEQELNEAIEQELRGLSDMMSERANTTIH